MYFYYGKYFFNLILDQRLFIIDSNNFTKNIADETGAALYITSYNGTTMISNNNFVMNSLNVNPEKTRSVIFLNDTGNITLTNSQFENNNGIMGVYSSMGSLNISNCMFISTLEISDEFDVSTIFLEYNVTFVIGRTKFISLFNNLQGAVIL